MSLVASPATSGKVAPVVSPLSPAVDELLERVGARFRPAAARHLLRFAHRRFGPQAPALPAEDLRGLAAAVLSLPGATADAVGQIAGQAWEALVKASPAIQVDNLLRGTFATDMPADVRSALRALAGHADSEMYEAWPERETLAGEAGVSVGRLDAILADLVRLGWVEKKTRSRPQGGKAPSVWTLTPMKGQWGWTDSETKRRRRAPPPPQTREARAARAASKAAAEGRAYVAPDGTLQCGAGRIIAMPLPAGHSDVAPRASESIHPKRPSEASKEGARQTPKPPSGGSDLLVEREEEKPPESTERPKPKETPWRWEIPARHLEAIASMGADVDKVVAHVFPDGMPMVTSQSAPIVSQSWQLAAIAVAEDPRFRLDVGPLANAAE